MKDIIVVCPTCDRAKAEFYRFMQFFGSFFVMRANKYRRMITLKNGLHITFMSSKLPVISEDFFVCSLQEYKQFFKNIAEKIKEEEK